MPSTPQKPVFFDGRQLRRVSATNPIATSTLETDVVTTDGLHPFVANIAGIAATADAHLTTRQVVDRRIADGFWGGPVQAITNTPPGSPSAEQRWITGTLPTGAWFGHPNALAAYRDGAWVFTPAAEGVFVFNRATHSYVHYTGSAWAPILGTGTVTSVGLVLPPEFSITFSPVTTLGDLSAEWAVQSPGLVFAGPSDPLGSSAVPAFRALVETDIPSLSWNHIGSDLPTTLSGYGITDGALNGAVGSSGLTMNTARVLGRFSADPGAIEEISIGTGLNLSALGVLSCTITAALATGLVGFGGGDGILTGSTNFSYNSTLATGGLTIANTTASISAVTGALKVAGGIGAGGDIFAAGTLNSTSTATTDSTTPGALNLTGSIRTLYGTLGHLTGTVYGIYDSVTLNPLSSSIGAFYSQYHSIALTGAEDFSIAVGENTTLTDTKTAGTVNSIIGYRTSLSFNCAGSTVGAASLFRGNWSYTAGTITTGYGLYLPSITGATTNYAIYTGTGLVTLGDTSVAVGATGVSALNMVGGIKQVISYAPNATVDRTARYLEVNITPTVSRNGRYMGDTVSQRLYGGYNFGVIYGYRADLTVSTTAGTLSGFYGIDSEFYMDTAGGTCTTAALFYGSLGGSAGTLTTAYGLLLEDITFGQTNYAIQTGLGLVRFGDTTVSTTAANGALVVTGGVGIGGALNVGGALTAGGVGTLGGLKVLATGITAPAAPAGTIAQVINGNGNAGVTRVLADVAMGIGGGYAVFAGRACRGTLTAPSALQAGDEITNLSAWGYGATGYSSAARGFVSIFTAENWTDAAQGTRIGLWTTTPGTILTTEKVRIWGDGGLQIGGAFSASPGAGALIVTSAAASVSTLTGSITSAGGMGLLGSIYAGGDVSVGGTLIIKNVNEPVNAIGNTGAGTITINCLTATRITMTVTGAVTLAFSNLPASGVSKTVVLHITNGGSQTFNFPANTRWSGGIAAVLTASGVDIIGMTTLDGGVTWDAIPMSLNAKVP